MIPSSSPRVRLILRYTQGFEHLNLCDCMPYVGALGGEWLVDGDHCERY